MMSFLSRERSNDGRRRPRERRRPAGRGRGPWSGESRHALHGKHRGPAPTRPRGWRRRPSGRATSRRRRSSSSVVPVLYVGGCQRSGSTLLDRMMSQISGHVSTGEIVHLWSRGLSANELCGCGDRFLACPFWSDVGRVAFGGWGAIDTRADPETAAKSRSESLHHLHAPARPFPAISERVEPLRGHPGSPLSSDPPRRWGCGRGFVQARIHGVPPSARSFGPSSHRPPGSGQPRGRFLPFEAGPPTRVGR